MCPTFLQYILQVISQWLMDQPPLGHKAPRPGFGRLVSCPACPNLLQVPSPMSSRHVHDMSHTFKVSLFLGMCWKIAWQLRKPGGKRALEPSLMSALAVDWAQAPLTSTTSLVWMSRGVQSLLEITCLEVVASWGWRRLGWTSGTPADNQLCVLLYAVKTRYADSFPTVCSICKDMWFFAE